MPAFNETARFSTLFFSLVVFLVLGPFIHDQPGGLARERVLFTLVVLSGLFAAATTRRAFITGLLLAVPAIVSEWIPVWNTALIVVVYLCSGGLLLYVAIVVVVEIFRQKRVMLDTILGGLSIYILIGLIFWIAYSALEHSRPGSFASGGISITDLRSELGIAAFPGLIYFSFVTLTTLGYGDMTPISLSAQHLAVAEAMIGQIFLATFIARLVAQHLAQSPPPR